MSIVTRRGDNGHSDLLFGKRLPKTDARFEAVGTIDELNAALGLVRARGEAVTNSLIDRLQEKLVGLMGELAVHPDDAQRYADSDYPSITSEDVVSLEREAAAIEDEGISFKGWARPGANGNVEGAQLDVARTVCRRAERRVLALSAVLSNPAIPLFLNRTSDLLWLLARKSERD
ncbi:MAG: cob(I)yrinic acid a,c-diamide adenosyltransferase [Akkermansiaceae bacterium]